MKRHIPFLLVLAGALAIGAWGDAAAWAGPETHAPRTAFTSGHYLAHAVARSTFERGWFLAPEVDLIGWPATASFRALMWPSALLAVLVPPLVAVNLTFLLIPAFNAGGGYLLGRAWLPQDGAASDTGAAVTAGLCAWHPWVRETLANGQLEQACIGAVALVWAAAERARRGGPARWSGVAVLQGLTAVSAPHLGLAGAMGLGLFAVVDLAGDGCRWRGWAGVLAAVGVGTAVAAAYHVSGYTSANQVLWPKGSPGHPAGLAGLAEETTLTSLLWPPVGGVAAGTTLHPNYLGWTLLAAALQGLLRSRARAAWAAAAAAAGLLLVSAGAALAPGVPGPYAVVGLFSDALAQSQSPYRFVSVAVVALALAAGMAVRAPVAGGMLVGIAWAETFLVGARPFPPADQTFLLDSETAPFRAGAGPILDLPFAGANCPAGNAHYVIEATRRLRPTPASIATTSVYGSVPGLQGELLGLVRDRRCADELVPLVRRWGFTTVVLHTHGAGCPVSAGLGRCLAEALGVGTSAPQLQWWDVAPAGAP